MIFPRYWNGRTSTHLNPGIDPNALLLLGAKYEWLAAFHVLVLREDPHPLSSPHFSASHCHSNDFIFLFFFP